MSGHTAGSQDARITLADGSTLPALGLGTWRAARGEVGAAVTTALELGYRHIDAAAVYGNEAEVGAALAAAFSRGLVQRQQVWITSKLWNDSHAPALVRPALERTLQDLGLDHLDLYLIHWPVVHRPGVVMPSTAADQIPLEACPLADTWGAMEELVQAGLCRQIGVSNVSATKLEALAAGARLTPAMNQVERHPYLQQGELLACCRRLGVAVTAFAPLGSSGPNRPPELLSDPVITAIANTHGTSPAQVLLAWGLACGTAVIPKSVRADRLAANLAATQLQLSAADQTAIDGLERGQRLIDGHFWELPGGPYTRANLWDEPLG